MIQYKHFRSCINRFRNFKLHEKHIVRINLTDYFDSRLTDDNIYKSVIQEKKTNINDTEISEHRLPTVHFEDK